MSANCGGINSKLIRERRIRLDFTMVTPAVSIQWTGPLDWTGILDSPLHPKTNLNGHFYRLSLKCSYDPVTMSVHTCTCSGLLNYIGPSILVNLA